MTEVALRNPHTNGEARRWVELMMPAAELASQVANTEFVPKAMRGNPAAIVAAIMYGDELGLGPMQSLAKIAVIDGKPTLSAEAQRALVLAAGHDMWITEATNTKVTVSGRREGGDQTSSVTWTLDDAKRANLAGRPAWRMYPRQMLAARATAELARLLFADVIGGLAATEELEDGDEIVEDEAPPAQTRARRRRTSKAETSARPAPEPEPERLEPPLPGEPDDDLPGESKSDRPITGLAETVELFGGSSPLPQAPEEEGEAPLPPPPAPQAGIPPEDASPSQDETPLTLARSKRAMDAIIGQLREQGKISTEHLWSAMATERGVDVTNMIELLGGYDEEHVLHWAPLRDSLTLAEARGLHARLATLWKNVEKGLA